MFFKSNVFVFFALTIISFVAFTLVYPFTLVGGDEGRFVQDALRIDRGETPIADYGTRAPILSWFIYVSSRLFGRSLFAFRLPVLLFSALTAGVLFLLGTLLVPRRVALTSALLFALTPITLWNNVVVKTEALTVLCVVTSAYFLMRGLLQSHKISFFIAGIPLGIAYIERQSVVAFMLTIALMVIWDAWRDRSIFFRLIMERGFFLFGGVIVGFLPVFLWIAYHDYSAAVQMWFTTNMFQAGLAAKETPMDASSGLISDFWRGWILTFVETMAVQAGLLFGAFGLFCMSFLKARLLLYERMGRFLSILFGVLFFGAFFIHSGIIMYHGTFRPWVFFTLSVGIVGLLFLFFHLSSIREKYSIILRDYMFCSMFLLFWMAGLFIAYSFFAPGYIREWIPALCLVAALLFEVLVYNKRFTIFMILLVVLFWLIGVAWFWNPKTGGWWWSQQTINDTAAYLVSHTTVDQKIFAANPLPVVMAGRRTVADITSYAMVFAKNADDHFSSFPSPNELLELLQVNPPPYVVVDRRMESHFFAQYKFFEDFVHNNYEPEIIFDANNKKGRTEIWRLKK